MIDLVSRVDAIKFAEYPQMETLTKEERVALVDDIPSAEIKLHGMWIERYIEDGGMFSKRRFYRSSCGDWQTYGKTNFCPNCGCDMREETIAEDCDYERASDQREHDILYEPTYNEHDGSM